MTLSDQLNELEETVRYLRTKARTVNSMRETVESLQEQIKMVAGDANGVRECINDLHERLVALETSNPVDAVEAMKRRLDAVGVP